MLGLVAAGQIPREPPAPRLTATPAGALRVIDGDTLQLADGRRVRLAAIDTPELGRPFAAEATAHVERLLAGRRWELSLPDPPRDAYGRLLADLLVEGESVSASLVEHGLAWLAYGEDRSLLARQAEAVERRAGVHARIARAGPGPFTLSARRFHRGDCPWLRETARGRDLTGDAAAALAAGHAPCRTCLPWPP